MEWATKLPQLIKTYSELMIINMRTCFWWEWLQWCICEKLPDTAEARIVPGYIERWIWIPCSHTRKVEIGSQGTFFRWSSHWREGPRYTGLSLTSGCRGSENGTSGKTLFSFVTVSKNLKEVYWDTFLTPVSIKLASDRTSNTLR